MIVPQAAPMMIPTAISRTFPWSANSRGSFSISAPPTLALVDRPESYQPGTKFTPQCPPLPIRWKGTA